MQALCFKQAPPSVNQAPSSVNQAPSSVNQAPSLTLLSITRILGIALFCLSSVSFAQFGPPRTPLGDGPWEYTTFEDNGLDIKVSVVTRGLSRPWSMLWLPNGDMLVSEQGNIQLRLIHNGDLMPDPIEGISDLSIDRFFDIALHPDFEENGWVYMTYIKWGESPGDPDDYWATTALARGQFDGVRLNNVEEIFVADAWRPLEGGDGSKITFGPDGMLYMSSSHRRELNDPQDPNNHVGKILRLNDDGSVPASNPFVGMDNHKPEVYSYGHRTVLGLAFHPETGELWEAENGPQGGDEVNILSPGKNYGWPVITYGIDYDGSTVTPIPWRAGMEQPKLFWVPSITASGMAFYTGDEVPQWQGNLFVGGMNKGRIPNTGRLERIVFGSDGNELRRESLLVDLKQRIRDVRQGPDGKLYVLTDENDGAGAILVLELL
jgi:aldose sugar dehydrogenase